MFFYHIVIAIPLVVFLQLTIFLLYIDRHSWVNRLGAIANFFLFLATALDYYFLISRDIEIYKTLAPYIRVIWHILYALYAYLFALMMEYDLKRPKLYFGITLLSVIPIIIYVFKTNMVLENEPSGLWKLRIINDSTSVLFWYSILFNAIMIGLIFFLLTKSPKIKTNFRVQKQATLIKKYVVVSLVFMFIPWEMGEIFNQKNSTIYQNFGIMVAMLAAAYAISRYRLETLQTSRLLTDFIEHLSDFSIIIEPDGTIISANKHSKGFCGYDKRELEGQHINMLLFRKDLIKSTLVKMAQRLSYSPNLELDIKNKDGNVLGYKTNIHAIRNQFDEILGYYMVFYALLEETKRFEHLQTKYDLSNREKDVAMLLIKGFSNQQIADNLFLSLSTIKCHTHSIYLKTNTKNKSELRNILS